ncbi:MAG TPA: hypothetical protein VFE98_05350 [Candidatus Bathyarchaeia archaeon]|nr:hypothetical protein [Candidatus Bathyarchaeia archaeon]
MNNGVVAVVFTAPISVRHPIDISRTWHQKVRRAGGMGFWIHTGQILFAFVFPCFILYVGTLLYDQLHVSPGYAFLLFIPFAIYARRYWARHHDKEKFR